MWNFLLPWRWKRLIAASIDWRFEQLKSELRSDLQQHRLDIERHESNHAKALAELNEALSELREESYNIRHTLSRQLDDASWHKLKSAAWDLQRGLAAVKTEIAAQLGFSLHDVLAQNANQRELLDNLDRGLAEIRAQLTSMKSASTGASHRPDMSPAADSSP